MRDDKGKLTTVVRRVSKAEIQAEKAVNQLIKSGVETLQYDRKKLEIIATVEDNGVVQTQIMKFGDICNQMELVQIDTNSKEARNDNIVKMYQQGNSQSEIARMHGISQTRVHNILKELGAL